LRDVDLEEEIILMELAQTKFKDKLFYIKEMIKEKTEIVENPISSTCNNFTAAKIKVIVRLGYCYFSGLHNLYMTPFLGL